MFEITDNVDVSLIYINRSFGHHYLIFRGHSECPLPLSDL